MNNIYFQLLIELHGIQPAIWRRFYVPSNISLDRFHDVIQIVMGWNDTHLHNFEINGVLYTVSPEDDEEGINEEGYRLNNLIETINTSFTYTYDFGDKWQHNITLENRDYIREPYSMHVQCIDGKMSCPPEDVGGIYSYEKFCNAIAETSNPAHTQMKEWYQTISRSDKPFNRFSFDLDTINTELNKYIYWSKDRTLPWKEM